MSNIANCFGKRGDNGSGLYLISRCLVLCGLMLPFDIHFVLSSTGGQKTDTLNADHLFIRSVFHLIDDKLTILDVSLHIILKCFCPVKKYF